MFWWTKNNLVISLILCLVLFSLSGALAQEKDLFQQALEARARGETKEALELFTKCVEEGIEPHHAYFQMGLIYLNQGNHRKAYRTSEKAIVAYEKHLAEQPEDHQSWFNLAYIHEVRSDIPGTKEWDQAKEALEKALSFSPDNFLYLLHLGYVYYKMDEYEKAEEVFLTLLDQHPTDGEVHYWLALVYRDADRLEEAYQEFTYVIETMPEGSSRYREASKELSRLEGKIDND